MLEFVEARAPGTLAAHYPPVTQVQFDALLGACPPEVAAAVPRAALDVLRWLGGSDSNKISIFGATFTTSIAKMLDDLEFQVLANRFFRVAIDRNPDQMMEDDLYVDLSRSDGEDAPLITITEEWEGEEPPARGHTILSRGLSRVFHSFELNRRGFLGYLAGGYEPGQDEIDWTDYSDAMTRLAGRMGLIEPVHVRPDLRCYSTPALSLEFDAMGVDLRSVEGFITIWIGAENREAFLNYAAQIRSHMPPLPILTEWRPPRRPGTPI